MKPWYLRLLSFAPRHWRGLCVIAAVMLGGVLMEVLRPWPLKLIVDNVLKGVPLPDGWRWVQSLPGAGTTGGLLAWLASATVLLFVAAQLLTIWMLRLRSDVGGRMANDLGAQVLERVQRTPAGRRSGATGDLVKRVTIDTVCVKDLILSVILPLLSASLTLLFMFLIMWRLDRFLAVVAIAAALPMAILMKVFSKPMADRTYAQQELEGEMMALAEQTLTAIPVVQAFAREEFEDRRFRSLSSRTVAAYLRAVGSQLQFRIGTGLVLALGTMAVMWIGGSRVQGSGLRVQEGTGLTVGGLLVLLSYLASLYAPLETLAYLAQGFSTASAGARRVLGVLDAHEELRDSPTAIPLPSAPPAGSSIRFDNLTFGYEPERPVLHGISADIPPGQTVAVVGPTGAGKSTLVSLIPRFADPWSGSVLIDGHDIRAARIADVRARVSIVLQEPFLLPLTISENIAYGRPGASRHDIEQAAVAANADSFIRTLPQGYDTVIGERGATLSGGERQRISIARAILKNAPILILDEPTASLDAQTEASVMEALQRLMAGRTCVVIAHRLSTVRRADQILVLENGRIVETGTHDQLLTTGGLYSRLSTLQGMK